jgi:hypothetical protein
MNDIDQELKQEYDFITNFQHITYEQKIARAFEELTATDPNKIMKRGWDEWDNMLGGIY